MTDQVIINPFPPVPEDDDGSDVVADIIAGSERARGEHNQWPGDDGDS